MADNRPTLDYATLPPGSNLRCTQTRWGATIEILPPPYGTRLLEWMAAMVVAATVAALPVFLVMLTTRAPARIMWIAAVLVGLTLLLAPLLAAVRWQKRSVLRIRRRVLTYMCAMPGRYGRYKWPRDHLDHVEIRRTGSWFTERCYSIWLTMKDGERHLLATGNQQEIAWLAHFIRTHLIDKD